MEKRFKRFIYADNAATTKVSEPVLEAMLPSLQRNTETLQAYTLLAEMQKRLLKPQENQLPLQSERSRRKYILQAAVQNLITGR